MLYIVSYANLELKIEYATASILASIVAFSGILGGLTIPTLSDYVGRRGTLIACNLMVMLTLASFVNLGPSFYILAVVAAMYGAFYSAIWPTYAAYAAYRFSRELAGTVVGLWTIKYGLGAMVGAALAGYLYFITQTFFWSFMLASSMACLSAILLLLSRTALRA